MYGTIAKAIFNHWRASLIFLESRGQERANHISTRIRRLKWEESCSLLTNQFDRQYLMKTAVRCTMNFLQSIPIWSGEAKWLQMTGKSELWMEDIPEKPTLPTRVVMYPCVKTLREKFFMFLPKAQKTFRVSVISWLRFEGFSTSYPRCQSRSAGLRIQNLGDQKLVALLKMFVGRWTAPGQKGEEGFDGVKGIPGCTDHFMSISHDFK